MTEPGELSVLVRYFAAARAAAGTTEESVQLPRGATVADLVATIGTGRAELARVLLRCSYLHNEVAVRKATEQLGAASTIDVLPPFAGG